MTLKKWIVSMLFLGFVFTAPVAQAAFCEMYGGTEKCVEPKRSYRHSGDNRLFASPTAAAEDYAARFIRPTCAQCGAVVYQEVFSPACGINQKCPYTNVERILREDTLMGVAVRYFYTGVNALNYASIGNNNWIVSVVKTCPLNTTKTGDTTPEGYSRTVCIIDYRDLYKDGQKKIVDLTGLEDGNEDGCLYGCNPVSLFSGAKLEREIDYTNNGVFPIVWERFYNNKAKKWMFSYGEYLEFKRDSYNLPTQVTAWRLNGMPLTFVLENGQWKSKVEYVLTTLNTEGNSWVLTNKNGKKEYYNRDGQLTRVKRQDGETHYINYMSKDRVSSVSDDHGRSIHLEYGALAVNNETLTWNDVDENNNPIVKTFEYQHTDFAPKFFSDLYPIRVKANNQTVVEYEWTVIDDGAPQYGNGTYLISTVNLGDEKVTGYMYGAGNGGTSETWFYRTDLTGKFNGNGVRTGKYEYTQTNGSSRVSSVQHGTTGDTVNYGHGTVNDKSSGTIISGQPTTAATNVGKFGGQTVPCNNGSCGGTLQASDIQYDTYGNPIYIKDFDGRIETRTYDGPRALMLSKTEASGTPLARTTTWTYHNAFPVPLTQVEPLALNGQNYQKTTTWTYNNQGNPLTQVESINNGEPSRSTAFVYTSNGDLQSITHPTGRVEYYEYDSSRQLTKSVDGYGTSVAQTTMYGNYDAHGYFTSVVLPNGVNVSLQRDALHRVRSTTMSKGGLTQTASVTYDFAGLLTESVLFSGDKNVYEYDTGERVVKATVYGPSNTIVKSTEFTYFTNNQIKTVTIKNSDGTTEFVSSFEYDKYRRLVAAIDAHNHTHRKTLSLQGVPTQEVDPLSRTTKYTVDNLARLKTIVSPQNTTSSYTYTTQDQHASASDDRLVTTQYQYNGFGDVVKMISPDSGEWNYEYNAAGLNTKIIDPRGVEQSLSYDPLERITQAVFTASTPSTGLEQTARPHTYTYDNCTNGKGMLCRLQWNEGEKTFAYDVFQRVVQMNDTDNQSSNTLTQHLSYNANGTLASRTYPSGKVLNYGYTNGRVSSISYDQQSVLQNIVWNSLGNVKSFEWGLVGLSGLGQTFVYDTAGLTTSVQSHITTWNYTYDAAHRVTGVSQTDPLLNETHTYDVMDRLKTSSVANWNDTLTFTYDNGGNKTSVLDASKSGKKMQYETTSNRLLEQRSVSNNVDSPTASPYQYDARGSVISFKLNTLLYNTEGRVVEWNNGFVTTMEYNPLGQRTKKTIGGVSEREIYDESGRLIGVYTSAGDLKEELVYLDGYRVVATVRPSSTLLPNVYAIITDHLQTPRFIVDPSTQQSVWSWDPTEPFGEQAPVDNHSGTIFQYDGRFAGQRFDTTTSSLHNGYRTYSAGLGRYIQSDPLGLEAGWNTYAYVGSNPLGGVDPLGLVLRDKNGNVVFDWNWTYKYNEKYGAVYARGTIYTDKGRAVSVFKYLDGNNDLARQNCHGYALGLPFWIDDPTFIYEDEYRQVYNYKDADITYFLQREGGVIFPQKSKIIPKHSGINIGETNGIQQSFGKWGRNRTKTTSQLGLESYYGVVRYYKKRCITIILVY